MNAPIIERVQIGRATLLLGDAYAIRPTLGHFDADVMDPPYAFDNEGGGAWRDARGASDQIVEEGLTEGFDHTIINTLLCGAVFVFCHNDQLPDLLPYLNGSFHRFALGVWTKPNPAPHRNKHYLADMEPYIHAWNRGFHPVGDHHEMHRWVQAKVRPSKLYGHPTVKPDDVMAKIMANVNGSSVCDPFMGTGSTGVAAIRHGKSFTGIEHNPAHFKTACQRIAQAVERSKPSHTEMAA
jgi:site-specific DNA-methyltransferase (adenine-specific)